MKDRLTKQQVDDVLAGFPYRNETRVEELSVTQIGELIEALRIACGSQATNDVMRLI